MPIIVWMYLAACPSKANAKNIEEKMKYEAVIFDLFGTLVDNLPVDEYIRVLHNIAQVLGVPRGDFAQAWRDKLDDRMKGVYGSGEDSIAGICRSFGLDADTSGLAEAVRLRREFTQMNMTPRRHALETLSALRSRGCLLGLVTDCTDEVPKVWQDTSFAPLIDHAVFSCLERAKKPDERMYLLACEGLGVTPSDCLYIGDGGSNELDGAVRVGMDAVRILPSRDDGYDSFRVGVENWKGPVIADLSEALDIVI